MHHTDPNRRPDSPQATPLHLLFVRMMWIAIGPGILLLTLFKIAENGTGWITALDVLFFVVLAITIASRWWDFNRGDRTTTTGEIATLDHMRRYTVIMVVLGVVAWIVANVLGNHVLG